MSGGLGLRAAAALLLALALMARRR